ncbi:unnamed protein product [Sphagnum compactum]
MERELGSNGSPLMTPRNVTPPPVRPLKWKSSTEEDKEQEKRPELSRLGMQDHAKNALQEEVLSDAVVVMTGREEEEAGEVAKLQQHVDLSGGLGLVDQTKLVGDLSLKGQSESEQIGGSDSPTHGHERKSSSGEDAMTMTIEFLRARLLAERAASKAAKQQVQQLNKQMIELERKLEQTVDERLKAERATEQALAQLKTAGSSSEESAMEVSGTLVVEPFGAVVQDGTQGRAAAPPQAQESSLVQPMPNVMSAEEEKKLEQDGTGDDKESIKVDLTQQDTNAANDSTSNLHASVAANGCTTDVTVLDKWPTDPQNMLETLNGSTQSQDQSRVAIEDRLRKMWSQISEEINALAEERSKDEHGCAELVSWMCQVSAVLQEILPTTMGPHGQSTQLETNENRHIVGGLAIENAQAQNAKMDAESKVALTALVDEYEAQESVQREWEKNYFDAQQTLEQNSQNLQDEEVSAGGGGIGTHPSHLKSSVLDGQEDNRSQDEGLTIRNLDDAYERAAQPEHRVLTTAAEKEDAPGEGLRRGQRQVLVDTGTHHLQDAHNGQKEGTARGLRAQEISGQQHHSRSYSEGSSRWAGDGNFETPSQSLDYGAGIERQEIDHTAYPRALTAQLSRFVNTNHGLQKDLQQYQELVDNEGANVWHRDTSQSVQGNYVAEKQYQQLQSRHLGAESVDKNSGFLNGELQLSLGYGPGYDAPPPKEPLAAEQPSPEFSTSRNVSNILQALQRLKQNIQGSSSSEKIPNIRSGGDPSPFSRAGYEGSSPLVKYLHQASAPSLHERLTHNSQQQHQLQHQSTYPQPYYQHKQQGAYSRSPGTLQSLDLPSNNSRSMTYNSDYCYPYSRAFVDEENMMGSSSRHHYPQNSKLDMIPVTKNGHSSYADKLNVGTGIQFFFP